jgi:hypothetical protein
MPWVLVLSLALMPPVQTSRPVDLKTLPADWPPLPDFKHTVDYVKWWEERVNRGITDDASALWAQLRADQEYHPEVWGWDANNDAPGLFTGIHPMPDRYAWDPRDHPDWEKALQSQKAHGLTARLIEASSHLRLAVKMVPPEPWKDDPFFEAGLTRDDRLLIATLFESRALHRHAVKVLLQNAWRAPEGRVDGEAMEQALETSLSIAHQLESNNLVRVDVLSAGTIRALVYHNILKALNDRVFGSAQVTDLDRWLAAQDRAITGSPSLFASDVATALDLLQFLYAPADGTWPEPPQPNSRNVAAIDKLTKSVKGTRPDSIAHIDLAREVAASDPRTAVERIVHLHLQLCTIARSRLPWAAVEEQDDLVEAAMRNPKEHAVLRLHLADWSHSYRGFLRTAECEADRRATRIILALHRHHSRTGEWPSRLSELRPMLPASIRIDPFSGKPFIYRLQDGQPLLYGAGYNAKDDGGKHKPYGYHSKFPDSTMDAWEVDYVYWPVQPDK